MDITEMRVCANFRITDENTDSIPMRGPMALKHFRSGVVYIDRTWNFYDESGKKTASLSSSNQKIREAHLKAVIKGEEIVKR